VAERHTDDMSDQLSPQQGINASEPTFDESVRTLMENVPAPVRAFLVSPERNRIILALTQKHRLRVDQGAVLERDLIFMLLGILTPAEFAASLQRSGVPQETLAPLVKDVNEQIFVRLRREEQATGVASAPKGTAVPSISPREPRAPAATMRVRTMQSDIAEAKGIPHAAPRIIMPVATTGQNMIVHPTLITPPSAPRPATAMPPPVAGMRGPQPVPSPRPIPQPPPNLPGVAAPVTFQPTPAGAQERSVSIPPVPFPRPPQTPRVAPPPKTYNTDPYREPVDDTRA